MRIVEAAQLDAVLRLVSPDHITPTGERMIRQALGAATDDDDDDYFVFLAEHETEAEAVRHVEDHELRSAGLSVSYSESPTTRVIREVWMGEVKEQLRQRPHVWAIPNSEPTHNGGITFRRSERVTEP